MLPVAKLKETASNGLTYIQSLPDVAEAEVFVSTISHLLTRINFTSSIPCNGIEEPKSTLSYGIGVQVVFKDGDRKKIGFGSQTADISIEGVKEAVEKARMSAVDDPDFHFLPTPSGSPVMDPDYEDPELMILGDEGLVFLGWKALEGAVKTFREHNIMDSVIIGGDVSIVQEKMAIASTTGIIACDEAASASAYITTMIEADNAKGSGYEVGMNLGEFVPENAGIRAAMSAIKSRNGRRVPSGKYKLILGPQPVADLLGNIVLPSLNLAVVDAASSAFSGRYGTAVADSRISIYDDGSLSGYPMSRRFTCEGLSTGRTELIKDGLLTGYLSNNYYRNKVLHDSSARDKIGADPADIANALLPRNGFRTGESMLRSFRGKPSIVPTNVIVETSGAVPSDELVRMIGDGIYIGRIWYTYPINGLLAGDFTCTVIGDSYLIEGGKITEPLKPNSIRIADNIRSLLNQVIGTTKDIKPVLLWGSPEVIYSPEIAVQDITLFSIGG
ncbi:MAG: TldD/PmbA family protein [Nitrospirae bacterium]|nr:TldD/PmbA family protein [Nitrospirota bacterium]